MIQFAGVGDRSSKVEVIALQIGYKSLGLLFVWGCSLIVFVIVPVSVFVLFPRHSGRMSQGRQVSRGAVWGCSLNVFVFGWRENLIRMTSSPFYFPQKSKLWSKLLLADSTDDVFYFFEKRNWKRFSLVMLKALSEFFEKNFFQVSERPP